MQAIEEKLRNLQRSRSDFQYALEVLQSEPAYLTDPHHPFVQILQKNAAHYKAASENEIQDLALVTNGAGSVGNVISRLRIPIINAYGCESGSVHAPNEWLTQPHGLLWTDQLTCNSASLFLLGNSPKRCLNI